MPNSSKFTWPIKTSFSLERPRYLLFRIQTNRHNIKDKNSSMFDNCKLTNFKLFLNSESYHESMNLKFPEFLTSVLYKFYLQFRKSYYAPIENGNSYINFINFCKNTKMS